MANEFKIKNGLIVNEGGAEITGSFYTTGSGFFTEDLTVTGSLYANNITGSLFGTSSWAENAISSSYAVSASYVPVTPPFPYTGSAEITGSLTVTGSTSITSGSLSVYKSGSVVFDIQGSQGQLFSITDQLSGSLFSVNDISGIPILEVFSDDTVKLGTYNAEAIIVSGNTANITGSLYGTASWAENAVTASFALNGGGGSPFPYTGSAEITGSLVVTGSIESNTVITQGQTIDAALIWFMS